MRASWLFVLLALAVVLLVAAVATDDGLERSSGLRTQYLPISYRLVGVDAPETWLAVDDRIVGTDRTLEAQILRFTRRGAINCGRLGRVATDLDMQAALSCAIDAARRRAAFSASRGYFNLDAYSAEGVLGIARGRVLRFTYIRGSNGWATVATEPCDTPVLVDRWDGKAFGCGG